MSVSARSRCGPGHIVMNVPVRSRPYTASRCGPGHSNEHACGRCNDLWNKMRRCGKVLGTKMVPIFAIKTAMDSCSLTVRLEICNCIFPCGLLDSHASHNYLFVRLQQLWYTQEKVAMTCCRQVKPIGAVDFDTQPTLWVSARLFWPIFRSRKRSQKLGPKMGPWS